MSGIETHLPTLITVITTAVVDSINPCAIGVLILMISVVLGSGGGKKRLLLLGSLYIFSIFLTYLLAGLGLLYFLTNVPLVVTLYISLVVGILIALGGLIEIKDYFWYGRWFSLAIPAGLAKRIHVYSERATVSGVMFLGAFVAAVELPCTGGPYLAIITLLSQYFDWWAFALLVLYNIIFLFPLVIILLLVLFGTELHMIQAWKQESKGFMRLAMGFLLIALGWLLIFMANGTINLA